MMPEPTTTVAAAATVAGAAVSTSALSAFGVQLGLHADVLIAGFFGSLVAMILLNTVPGSADTWQGLVRTAPQAANARALKCCGLAASSVPVP